MTILDVAARTAMVSLLVTAAVAATPAARWAERGALVSAAPADGAAVADSPPAVQLTFDRRPDVASSHVPDGTEASGSLRFSVGTEVPPLAGAGDAQRAAESAAAAGHQHGIDPFSAVLLVLDFGVLFGVVILLVLRPRRRDDGPSDGGTLARAP